jgi:DNA topoisomerase-2
MASNDLNKYQKKSDKEHILDNPDMYIGSIENVDANEFIYDSSNIIRKNISYIAGLYKLFDECIVNCRDHAVRMEQIIKNNSDNNNPLTYIDIGIDEEGIITFTNDGNGIDVAEHPEYKLWIPEMIFAHLRTSTNYDKSEKKIVGGKNGYGIKLVFIWSSWGKIETIDHKRGLKYIQEFHNNLDIIDKPKITKCKTKPYTKVSFKPDYKRLGLSNGLSEDMLNLFKRRIYDIAAVTNKNIKVKLNSQLVPIKTFQQYVKMIISDTEHKYESPDERWEYVIALAPEGEFYQMSFVNGIYTSKGGKHVDYIMNQIIKKITLYIKNKKKVDVKPSAIRENIALFLRCDIENPSYESQTKDFMNTPSSKFGSSCEVSDKFIENICKMGIMSSACAITEVKENKSQKKTDGSKNKNIRGIPKLVDANYAGTAKSKDCMLILCEGDSAKAGIISGLSQDDRNYIGVYPMKGKLFNVRGESVTKIGDNKEITEIKQILGLEHGKEYTQDDVNTKLRYSKVVFMTDQDLDGSHIKGLGINLFDSGWNSLIQIPNFIGYINTPILKASKGSQMKQFYNEGEFEEWKKENDIKGWNIKYYKGLGTSTGKEFKEYFKEKKVIYFNWNNEESSEYIDMVFNKKRSDDRKDWLSNYNRELYLDTNKTSVTYKEFIDKEFIHFSKYDNDRSIPNLIDGLKISQRKILFAAFKKKLNNEIKVAQFSGYVSEHSGYHHGEASLNGAIINMAQNYVGSNNINIFEPRGQFGTRIAAGKDSASERYIFTLLNKITRLIYPTVDDNILNYLSDDGQSVEPIYYVPIIPMVLINGAKGIGTGFSTDIMSYNPLQIINRIELMLKKDINYKLITINPYYQGFTGNIEKLDNGKKYLITGSYEIINDNKIKINELPIGTWTQDYKEFLETLIDSKNKDTIVKDFNDNSTDIIVNFIIEFKFGILKELLDKKIEHGLNGIHKFLKLYSIQSTTNMHLFNNKEQLKKYNSPEEIIDDYYDTRLEYYKIRKEFLLNKLNSDLKLISNKTRFINDNLNNKIDLRKKKKDEIISLLNKMKFDDIYNNDYEYLRKMPMDSVCEESIEKMKKEKNEITCSINDLESNSNQDLWLKELLILKEEYMRLYNNEKPKEISTIKVKKNKKK